MRDDGLTDLEKQELLQILFINKIYAPGLERIVARVAESISSDDQRQVAVAMTSRYLATFGNRDEADTLIRRHLEGVAEATALASIGSELVRSQPSEAADYLQRAYDLLSTIEDVDDRVSLLQRLVDGYLDLRQNAKACDMANQISMPAERVYTLSKIATRLWDEGETEKADKVLLEARASVAETESSDRADALDDIARLLVHMGKESAALNTWEEALQLVNGSLDPPKLVLIICKGLASIGRHERAREVALLIQNEARRAQALALINEQ
jgi:hypothetical protein